MTPSAFRIVWHFRTWLLYSWLYKARQGWVPKFHSVPCTSCKYPLCVDILVWTFKTQFCVHISCIFVTYTYIINLLDTKSAMILITKIAITQFLNYFCPKRKNMSNISIKEQTLNEIQTFCFLLWILKPCEIHCISTMRLWSSWKCSRPSAPLLAM